MKEELGKRLKVGALAPDRCFVVAGKGRRRTDVGAGYGTGD
jgi:hypothetical protein